MPAIYRNGGNEDYGKDNHERTGTVLADWDFTAKGIRACQDAGLPVHPDRNKNTDPDRCFSGMARYHIK